MLYFICKESLDSIELLITHIKRRHFLNTNDVHRCIEIGCYQIFNNLGSFKKHMKRKHQNIDSNSSNIDMQICNSERIENILFPTPLLISNNKFLIHPILDAVVSFSNSKFKENIEERIEFCSIVANFRNIFKFCSTDYLLYKWLH